MAHLHPQYAAFAPGQGLRRPVPVPLLKRFPGVLLGYLCVATGTILSPWTNDFALLKADEAVLSIVFVLTFIAAFVASRNFRSALGTLFMVTIPLLFVLMVQYGQTDNVPGFVEKLDGSLLALLISAPLLAVAHANLGMVRFLRLFQLVCFSVLMLTVVYKYELGFFDRGVRFLFNGAIVFGWLMGQAALVALYLALSPQRRTWDLLAFLLFALATLWVQSKGPFLALIVGGVLLLFLNLHRGAAVKATIALAIASVAVPLLFPESFLNRFSAISRFWDQDLSAADYGSVQFRYDMWLHAVDIWQRHPTLGIGMGNWKFFALSSETYPHNVLLEILAEGGTVMLLVFVFTVGLVFWRTSGLGRILMVYLAVCLSFSGDFSYLRVFFALPMCFMLAKSLEVGETRNQAKMARRHVERQQWTT